MRSTNYSQDIQNWFLSFFFALFPCFYTIVLNWFITGSVLCLLAEGDLYFTVKLQNYTAVEKDEVILTCELSKAAAEVKWFKDGTEIFPSKNVLFQSDGKKRMLVIKKAAKSSMGVYICDCGTDKTTADLNIEGNTCRDPAPPPDHGQDCRIRPHPLPFAETQSLLGRCSSSLHPSLLSPVLSFWMFVMLLMYNRNTWG